MGAMNDGYGDIGDLPAPDELGPLWSDELEPEVVKLYGRYRVGVSSGLRVLFVDDGGRARPRRRQIFRLQIDQGGL